MAAKSKVTYENNPFMIGLDGLKLLFGRARSVAIFAIVLAVAGALGQAVQVSTDIANGEYAKTSAQVRQEEKETSQAVARYVENQSTAELVLHGVAFATVVFVFILIGLIINGILDYTSGRLRSGHDVSLKTALGEVWARIASFLWLQLVIAFKILLWSLLFIIPGLIMAVRYSLSGTAFFAENLRGTAAVKRSLELTKDAWLTTFAGQGLWNLMTAGLMAPVLQPGTNAVLYRQLADVTDAGTDKPAAHWLSWLVLIVPIALLTLLLLLVIVGLGFLMAVTR